MAIYSFFLFYKFIFFVDVTPAIWDCNMPRQHFGGSGFFCILLLLFFMATGPDSMSALSGSINIKVYGYRPRLKVGASREKNNNVLQQTGKRLGFKFNSDDVHGEEAFYTGG